MGTLTISGRRRSIASSDTSKLSASHIISIMERLKYKSVRDSTASNYLAIWRSFNKFLIRLDRKPDTWEERTALYCTHLIDQGSQSSTIKSYVSAIKATLKNDGYIWNDNYVLLAGLIKACRLKNDHVSCRFPIKLGLLEMILFETERNYRNIGQPFLEKLFKALFALVYYGMMRIGELVQGNHTVKAKDVHVGQNKNKILIYLNTSKTHGMDKEPQMIKITGVDSYSIEKRRFFCPFDLLCAYVDERGGFESDKEPFFVFRDGTPVKPDHVRRLLCKLLMDLNLDHTLYNTHSFRAGRSVDMLKSGAKISEIKSAGRWQSNVLFKYLKFS